ncbi:hypothetical protein MAR_020136 [Mya arenaria]|uniref:Uncharacterized protein n=1 Tax=Mya arenaria TaxID=6604 RepID=A0ABY7E7J8_MYAAR|nr:hypothetical protein MAR_020136 [Mya arenaria]
MLYVSKPDDGRAAALLRYKILAGLMGFLSVGLLSIGIIAVITGQYILSMFLFMGCFIGTILAGIGGMNTDTYGFDDEGTGYEDKVKLLAGTVSTTNTAYGGSGMGGMGTNANTQNLQEQNRLLQEQLRLQQELINTQQRAQGPQFGVYPPPPANYPSGGTYPASDPAYPPGPPPSYGNI